MIRFVFILLLLVGTVGASWYFSNEVYTFYIKNWYTRVSPVNRKEHLEKLYRLQEKEQWGKLRSEARIHSILFPGDSAYNVLVARAYLAIKNRGQAALYYRKALDGKDLGHDAFVEAVEFLYHDGYYGDLVHVLFSKRGQLGGKMLTVLGVSLYHNGDTGKALSILEDARQKKSPSVENYVYTGLALIKTRDYTRAVFFLEKAFRAEPANKTIQEGLIQAYRGAGRYEDAEKVIRWKLR